MPKVTDEWLIVYCGVYTALALAATTNQRCTHGRIWQNCMPPAHHVGWRHKKLNPALKIKCCQQADGRTFTNKVTNCKHVTATLCKRDLQNNFPITVVVPGSAPSNRYGWLQHFLSCISILSSRILSDLPAPFTMSMSFIRIFVYLKTVINQSINQSIDQSIWAIFHM